jgi:hypothetical protein
MSEQFTLYRLRNELFTDPASLGYTQHFSALAITPISGLINSAWSGQFLTSNTSMTPASILAVVVPEDLAALSDQGRAQFHITLTVAKMDMSTDRGFGVVAAPFPVWSQTYLNLVAARQRIGTRAEMLWGAGFGADGSNISTAITAISAWGS